jgi:DNA-binding NarL/FixJ family response regulator
MSRRRVLIVDDDAEFRNLARRLLEHGGYEVVGEADDAAGALRNHASLRPEIVLLDVQLPDLDGFAIADILAAQEEPPIVVLISSRDRGAYRFKLAATSARAFLPKDELSMRAFDEAVSA